MRWRGTIWVALALVLAGLYASLWATAQSFGLPALGFLFGGVILVFAGERIDGGRQQPNIAALIAALGVMRAAGWLPPQYDTLHIAIDLVAGGFALWALAMIVRRTTRQARHTEDARLPTRHKNE